MVVITFALVCVARVQFRDRVRDRQAGKELAGSGGRRVSALPSSASYKDQEQLVYRGRVQRFHDHVAVGRALGDNLWLAIEGGVFIVPSARHVQSRQSASAKERRGIPAAAHTEAIRTASQDMS